MQEMIQMDPSLDSDDILRFKLIRNRRVKQGRTVNGTAEWFLKDTKGNKTLEKLKNEIIQILS